MCKPYQYQLEKRQESPISECIMEPRFCFQDKMCPKATKFKKRVVKSSSGWVTILTIQLADASKAVWLGSIPLNCTDHAVLEGIFPMLLTENIIASEY